MGGDDDVVGTLRDGGRSERATVTWAVSRNKNST